MSKLKPIEQISETSLLELWSAIGGEPHLYFIGKDDFKKGLITGEWDESGIKMSYYEMTAIVKILKDRGFDSAVIAG